MSLRKNYKTDKKAELDGVSVVIGINEYNDKPMSIILSRISPTNKRYTKALQEATKPYEAAMQADTMDVDLGNKIFRQVFAETILLGWDNIPLSDITDNDDDNNKVAEFSVDNAMALFDLMPEAFEKWDAMARKAATFRAKAMDNAAKN